MIVAGAAPEQSNIKADYMNLDELKNGVDWAKGWRVFKHQGHEFVVCIQDFPSYGQSSQTAHMWKLTPKSGYKHVWMLNSYGLGAIEIAIDEQKGIVTVHAIARKGKTDECLGSVVCSATKD